MADVYLMRHAHYVGHRPGYHAPDDAELSPQGRRDTITAVQRMPAVVGIVSSPLRRARQTAELLAEHSGIPLLGVLPDLREWRSPTAVQGIPPEEFPADYVAWRAKRLVDPASRYEDGESLKELGDRAARVRDQLIALAGSEGPVLVVAHKIQLRVLTAPEAPTAAFDPAVRDEWPFLGLRALK
ncbi:histidine phosphatase family protein [Nocardiopsis lucentensis]|uniref:histidine phosphatase family protein n=1 Tax=Nocardiopsis lucentensis TaxID=53441 RepID=UPI00036BAC83|nr:histidine phosphatase family protein [Nocardiopsis lucentensis]